MSEQPKVKKAFQPLVDLLNENITASVEDVMPRVLELCAPKRGGGTGGATTYLKDSSGVTVAVHDYYFKKWFLLVGDDAVEFGSKASAASGVAPMCKEGTSLWTQQQRKAKTETANILTRVEEGTLDMADISQERERIEAERTAIADTDLVGFDTMDQAREALEVEGYTFN